MVIKAGGAVGYDPAKEYIARLELRDKFSKQQLRRKVHQESLRNKVTNNKARACFSKETDMTR